MDNNGFRVLLMLPALLAVVLSCGRGGVSGVEDGMVEDATDSLFVEPPLGFSPEKYTLKEDKVRRGEFFADLLMKLGMDAQSAYNLSSACDTVFDVRTLRVGNKYRAYYTADTLEYQV